MSSRDSDSDDRAFVWEHVTPHASSWEDEQAVPREVVVRAVARAARRSHVDLFRLLEAVGAASPSLGAMLTVHTMVTAAIGRWGSHELEAFWLPRLARGEAIAAFALSEPDAGTDASAIITRATRHQGRIILEGAKSWVTSGALADVFLVFAQSDDGPVALLLERTTPGLDVAPVRDALGFGASQTASLTLAECDLPDSAIVASAGFGLSHVAQHALGIGRLCVASSAVGMLRACLEISAAHARTRVVFGVPLREHPLAQRLVAETGIAHEAARLLCESAAQAHDAGDTEAVARTLIAKTFAAREAAAAASRAVQLLGAGGCARESLAARLYRDSKILEIVEGSHELHQILLGDYFCDAAGGP